MSFVLRGDEKSAPDLAPKPTFRPSQGVSHGEVVSQRMLFRLEVDPWRQHYSNLDDVVQHLALRSETTAQSHQPVHLNGLGLGLYVAQINLKVQFSLAGQALDVQRRQPAVTLHHLDYGSPSSLHYYVTTRDLKPD